MRLPRFPLHALTLRTAQAFFRGVPILPEGGQALCGDRSCHQQTENERSCAPHAHQNDSTQGHLSSLVAGSATQVVNLRAEVPENREPHE